MKNIYLRKAVKEDCFQLLELVKELAHYEEAPEQVTVSLEHFEESGFGDHPVWWAYVAEDTENMKIVGMALYYIRFSTWKGQRLYLEDIVITQEWRGKGVGSLLFKTLVEEMNEKKFKGMTWQVLEWNEPAIQFYKKYKAEFDPEWVNCSIENK